MIYIYIIHINSNITFFMSLFDQIIYIYAFKVNNDMKNKYFSYKDNRVIIVEGIIEHYNECVVFNDIIRERYNVKDTYGSSLSLCTEPQVMQFFYKKQFYHEHNHIFNSKYISKELFIMLINEYIQLIKDHFVLPSIGECHKYSTISFDIYNKTNYIKSVLDYDYTGFRTYLCPHLSEIINGELIINSDKHINGLISYEINIGDIKFANLCLLDLIIFIEYDFRLIYNQPKRARF